MRKLLSAIAITSSVVLVQSSASAEPTKVSVLMQVRDNFVPSTTRCAIDSFVGPGPASQPDMAATICAIGGPFGTGKVGTEISGNPPKFSGMTIHLDRTFAFNNGSDVLKITSDFSLTDRVGAGSGGLNYFAGTWSITGGSGAFASVRGKGSMTVVLGSNSNAPPPPEYGREELVGWTTQGQDPLQFQAPSE